MAAIGLYGLLHERGLLAGENNQDPHPNYQMASFERRVAMRELVVEFFRTTDLEAEVK